ncbi:extracellular solute-binding protein [Streptomyces sp. SAI-149]|uniref:ABC transporter substrate-binding protein n=1 Tax=Streptomyces sp. SAI-149 TaxID=2940542 RepID=UPI00247CA3AA|nr:ABC-type glycerol-3-phosphate transport system substrate-binding protein [Streptomyces sp. SAI-149]
MSTTTRPRPARRSAAVFVAGLLTLTAAACGTSGPGSSGKAGDATMWALQTGDQPVLEGAIKEWNEQHPDAGIKVNFFSSDAYKPKIRTAVGAKQAPTLIYSWGGGVLKSYVDAGAVADLSGYQKKYPELFKRYLPSTLKNNQFDGKTYALPFNKVNPVFLYYNKSVFADAGVQPPKTWDDLLELVPVFKKKGIAPLALGGQSKWPSLMYLEYLVDRIGGSNVFQRVLDGKARGLVGPGRHQGDHHDPATGEGGWVRGQLRLHAVGLGIRARTDVHRQGGDGPAALLPIPDDEGDGPRLHGQR